MCGGFYKDSTFYSRKIPNRKVTWHFKRITVDAVGGKVEAGGPVRRLCSEMMGLRGGCWWREVIGCKI